MNERDWEEIGDISTDRNVAYYKFFQFHILTDFSARIPANGSFTGSFKERDN